MNRVTVTRRARFEAAHRLWSSQLGASDNESTYGKCSRTGGHGHNYEIEVSVTGPVDPVTGLVVRRDRLDEAIESRVISRCDHRNLDEVLNHAEVTTGENLAVIFHRWLADAFEAPLALTRVRVYETPRNIFDAPAKNSRGR